MTEQETINVIRKLNFCGLCTTGPCSECERKLAKDAVLVDLEEIQQYRAFGTVEEIKEMIAEISRWHSDRLNDKIKNPFARMSTLICHNCDHKDEYIEELESEIAEYKTIGTTSECREAREKQKVMKPTEISPCKTISFYKCPVCGEILSIGKSFCCKCGQALDWDE